jgi:hypothetical protein
MPSKRKVPPRPREERCARPRTRRPLSGVTRVRALSSHGPRTRVPGPVDRGAGGSGRRGRPVAAPGRKSRPTPRRHERVAPEQAGQTGVIKRPPSQHHGCGDLGRDSVGARLVRLTIRGKRRQRVPPALGGPRRGSRGRFPAVGVVRVTRRGAGRTAFPGQTACERIAFADRGDARPSHPDSRRPGRQRAFLHRGPGLRLRGRGRAGLGHQGKSGHHVAAGSLGHQGRPAPGLRPRTRRVRRRLRPGARGPGPTVYLFDPNGHLVELRHY